MRSPAPIRPPELSELETFAIAVELGSITQAAARLHISPPAAAKRIGLLEALAEEPLLMRSRRGVTPTESGLRVYPVVRELMAGRDRVLDILGHGERPDPLPRAGVERVLGATAGMAAEERLRETERIFAAIFHAIREDVALWDARDERMREVNTAVADLLGIPRDRARDAAIGDLEHVQDVEQLQETLRTAAATGRAQDLEVVVRGPGAGRRRVAVRAEPLDLRGRRYLLITVRPLPDVLTSVAVADSERGPQPIPAELVVGYLDALRSADLRAAEVTADAALAAGADIATIHTHLLAPAMDRLGELWERGVVSIADEHAATEICHRVAARVFWRAGRAQPGSRGRVVVAAVGGERHALGARLVGDALEGAGYDVALLGADTPPHALLDMCRRHSPAVVGLSVTMADHIPAVLESVAALGELDRVPALMLGGRAATVAARHGYDGAVVVDAVEALTFVEQLAGAAVRI